MASEFKITRTVEFSDTDAAGIMHFSNFFRYMEGAEHAFIRSLGLTIMEHGSAIGWPRVAASCEYKRPLKFEDSVEVRLKVAEKSEKAIKYAFSFRKTGETNEKAECARGELTVVCCSIRDG